MKLKINYEIDDIKDYYILEGDSTEEIIIKNEIEIAKRGLDESINNMWSEQIEK